MDQLDLGVVLLAKALQIWSWQLNGKLQNKLVSSSTNRYQDLIKIVTGKEQANPSTYNNVPQTKMQLTFGLKVEEAKLLSEKMLLLHTT